ncbi:MAG: hypothetical protein MUF27_00075 [Acidobacteria bacterium]|jgi:hypothetical protein|nr:hypothetical protein [Acidobacteriota bacterium]
MSKFLLMVGAAVLAAVVLFTLWVRTPRGWTKTFLAIAWISAIAFPVCAVLHNAVDAVFHVDEPVFFLLAIIGAPVGLAVGLLGAAITELLARRRPA